MKSSPSSFYILGMLGLGATSGYAIKKATDISMRFFWPTSLAQVYPELARLTEQGLVSRREDPHGARNRSAYEITDRGRQAMRDWLNSSKEEPLRFRDEGMLRLYFADVIGPEERVRLASRLRERARDTHMQLRHEILPLAEPLTEVGVRFPGIVARFGADVFEFVEQWFERLEAELEEELEGARD